MLLLILTGMKRTSLPFLILATVLCTYVRAETESIDLKALAKKARPAVMLLVVSDAAGKEIATGTGFLVSSDGKLISNHHVIENAASAVAKAENGGLFPVEGVLADDPKNDLVLLKLKAKDLPFLPLGNSEKTEVGTRIAVIGSPLGLEGTLSEGIVSAVRELMGDMKMLQVTAAVSPGSSGSPVMNVKGDVVGIATALLRGGQALNFAVPVECGARLLEKVKPSSVPQPLNQSTNAGGEDVIFSDPDWRAAGAAVAAGDDVGALKLSKALVARYPDNATAWWALGCAFANLNFTDDAIAAYRQAIKIKPDFAPVWYNLGLAYGNSGRTDDAIAAWRQAIKIKPDLAVAWNSLGYAYSKSGRTDDAIAAYRQAIKFKPDDAKAWFSLGAMYGQSGRTDDEVAAYEQALKLNPDFFVVWWNLGLAYLRIGQDQRACRAFENARRIDHQAFESTMRVLTNRRLAAQIEECLRDAN
jgi:Flp pilus assembly protein TadD